MAKNYKKLVDRGCWIWFGSKKENGYAQITRDGKHMYVHRAMYEFFREPIPTGLVVDHLCMNRACVNPMHMELVDQKTNNYRGRGDTAKRAAQTHCKRGHPLSGDNLGIIKDGNGLRYCKRCRCGHEMVRYWKMRGVVKTVEECIEDSDRLSMLKKSNRCQRGHLRVGKNAIKGGKGCRICDLAQQRVRSVGKKISAEQFLSIVKAVETEHQDYAIDAGVHVQVRENKGG